MNTPRCSLLEGKVRDSSGIWGEETGLCGNKSSISLPSIDGQSTLNILFMMERGWLLLLAHHRCVWLCLLGSPSPGDPIRPPLGGSLSQGGMIPGW